MVRMPSKGTIGKMIFLFALQSVIVGYIAAVWIENTVLVIVIGIILGMILAKLVDMVIDRIKRKPDPDALVKEIVQNWANMPEQLREKIRGYFGEGQVQQGTPEQSRIWKYKELVVQLIELKDASREGDLPAVCEDLESLIQEAQELNFLDIADEARTLLIDAETCSES